MNYLTRYSIDTLQSSNEADQLWEFISNLKGVIFINMVYETFNLQRQSLCRLFAGLL